MSRRDTLREAAVFVANSGAVLALKLGMMWAFIRIAPPLAAYLVTHVVVFFVSYGLHARLAFGRTVSLASLGSYAKTVAAFKALDYLVFSVLFRYLSVDALAGVLIASAAVMALRFVAVRKALKEPLGEY